MTNEWSKLAERPVESYPDLLDLMIGRCYKDDLTDDEIFVFGNGSKTKQR